MREKMEHQKLSKDLKRQQEKEFLTRIKEMEQAERNRYLSGRKAINTDFVDSNGMMMQANVAKKIYAEEAKKADKYNYFPFISGDLIEKHRAQLGAQLKNDL